MLISLLAVGGKVPCQNNIAIRYFQTIKLITLG